MPALVFAPLVMPQVSLAQSPYSQPAYGQSPGYGLPMSASSDPAERLGLYIRVLAASPRDLSALLGAGQAALDVGDPNAALGFFARAEDIAPYEGRAKAGLASALVMIERPDDALRLFGEAVGRGVREETVAKDRGLAYDLRGDTGRAQRDYATALKLKSDDETVRRYALSLGIGGDRKAALALLEPLLRKQDQGAWRARAFILAMTGDVEGAKAVTRQLMSERVASSMSPFLTRLATLNAADRAHAVNFGSMPSDGTQLAQVQPGDPYAAALRSPQPTFAQRNPQPSYAQRDPQPSYTQPSYTQRGAPPVARRSVQSPPITRSGSAILTARAALPTTAPASDRAGAGLIPSGDAFGRQATIVADRADTVPTGESLRAASAAAVATPRRARTTSPTAAPTFVPARERVSARLGTRLSTRIATIDRSALPAAARGEPTTVTLVPSAVLPAPGSLPAASLPGTVPTRSVVIATPVALPTPTPTPTPVTTPAPVLTAAAPPEPVFEVSQPTAPPPVSTAIVGSASPAPATRLAGLLSGIEPEAETVAAELPSARELRTARAAARRKVAELAAATAAEDQAKREKAEAAAEAKRNPARLWVQIATGANESGLPLTWRRIRDGNATALKGMSAYSVPFKATNRLLVGPVKNASEARTLVNALAKGGVSATVFNSTAGQEIASVGGR